MSDKRFDRKEEEQIVRRGWRTADIMENLIRREKNLESLYRIMRKRVLEVTEPNPDSDERGVTTKLPSEERVREVDGIGEVNVVVSREEKSVEIRFKRITVEKKGAFSADISHVKDLVTIRLFWGGELTKIRGEAVLEDFGDKDLIDSQKREELFDLLGIDLEDNEEGKTKYELVY